MIIGLLEAIYFLKMISKYFYVISFFGLVIFISRTLTYIRSKMCLCVRIYRGVTHIDVHHTII